MEKNKVHKMRLANSLNFSGGDALLTKLWMKLRSLPFICSEFCKLNFLSHSSLSDPFETEAIYQ